MGVVKYTGPVASFHCPTNAEIRSLKVHFSPKQLGEGTPSPENVREIEGWDEITVQHHDDIYGVPSEYQRVEYIRIKTNSYFDSGYVPTIAPKIITKIEIMTSTDADLFGFANNIAPSFIVNPTNYGTFWYERWGSTNYTIIIKQIFKPTICEFGQNQIIDDTLLKTFPNTEWSTNTQTIRIGGARNTHSDMKLYYCDIYDGTNLVCRFVPCRRKVDDTLGLYDSVNDVFLTNQGSGALECGPDVGETVEYEFGVLGKNKFDKSQSVDGRIMKSNGSNYTAESGYYISPFIPVTVGVSYTKNSPTVDAYHRFATYSSDNVDSFVRVLDTSNTITIESGENYIRFCGKITELDTAQLELGSTTTSYEPYDPNKTVYGGWIDLISGEVCEEYIAKDMGQINWNKSSSGNKFYITGLSPNYPWQSDLTMYCSIYKFDGTNVGHNWYGDNYTIRYFYLPSGNVREIYIHDERYDNVQDFKTAMEGINLVYKLNTPNTYHLAPTQLQTFLGQNNVWSNADYVEVEYDLYETQEILNRKAFIMANQPHLVAPEASQLQSFTTDLAAPLKECKVYFKPKQDFNGYDKPWPAGGGKNLFNWNVEESVSTTGSDASTARTFILNTYVIGMAANNYYRSNYENWVLNPSISNGTISFSSGTAGGYGIAFPLKLPAEQIYYLSGTGNGYVSATYYDENGNMISYQNNRLNNTISIPANAIITLIGFYASTPNTSFIFSNIQLEAGSTATSYEPYENICPIEGWEGCDVTRAGLNIFDMNTFAKSSGNYSVQVTNGVAVGTATSFNQLFSKDGKYLIFNNFLENRVYIRVTAYNEGNNNSEHKNGLLVWVSYTTGTSDHYYFYNDDLTATTLEFSTSANKTINKIGVSYANGGANIWHITEFQITPVPNITAYYPYNAATIPITFPTEAGTIYGGYVDLVRGEVVATSQMITVDGSQTLYGPYTFYNGSTCTNRYIIITNLQGGYSSSYNTDASSHFSRELSTIWAHPDNSSWKYTYNNQQLHMVFENSIVGITEEMSSGERTEKIKNWLIENKPQFIYPLLAPIHYSITPEILKTLRGTNNIWSSANDKIEIKYWKH